MAEDQDNGSDVRDDEIDAPPAQTGWTPPATPDELNAIIEKRIARERKRFADYDQIKAKAQRADELEAATATDLEKAQKAARDEGRQEALREATPRLVRAEFRAAAKGALTSDQLTELLEDIDLSRFVTADGEVDEKKIAKKINALAPPPPEEKQGSRFPDLGGGDRGTASTATDMNERIRELARNRQ